MDFEALKRCAEMVRTEDGATGAKMKNTSKAADLEGTRPVICRAYSMPD